MLTLIAYAIRLLWNEEYGKTNTYSTGRLG